MDHLPGDLGHHDYDSRADHDLHHLDLDKFDFFDFDKLHLHKFNLHDFYKFDFHKFNFHKFNFHKFDKFDILNFVNYCRAFLHLLRFRNGSRFCRDLHSEWNLWRPHGISEELWDLSLGFMGLHQFQMGACR